MPNDPTTQILNHLFTASIIGITGGATWIVLVLFADFPPFWGLWNMVRLTTACALFGGLIVTPFFGKDGAAGLVLAFVGAIGATAIGSMGAVGIVENPDAALWGPVMVLGAIIAQPAVGGVWLLGMALAHLVAIPRVTPESSDCP